MKVPWKVTVGAIGLMAGLSYAAAQTAAAQSTGGSTPQSPASASGQSGSQPGQSSPGADGQRVGQGSQMQGSQPSATPRTGASEGAQSQPTQPSGQRGASERERTGPSRAQDAQQERRDAQQERRGTQAQERPRDRGGSEAQQQQLRDRNGAAAQQQRDRDGAPGTAQQQREGTAAEGGIRTAPSVRLSTEQRTQIRQIFTRGGLADRARIRSVDFNISIGTAVPRTVNLVALPPDIIEVYPAWRGYMFFVVGDEIVVVEPGSLRIVAILPA